MKRRNFIKNVSALGLGTVTMGVIPSAVVASEKNEATLSLKGIPLIKEEWDVIVVGGGPSGCTAATAAARGGARTLLIESTGALGGMGTSGLLNAWCPMTDGQKIIYKGLAEYVFTQAKKGVPHIRYNDWVPINCEQLKVVYDDLVTSHGVKVLFYSMMAAVEMKNQETVEAIIIANKAGLTAYKAKLFIDCTGDGDLAARAGASFEFGNEKGDIQQGTLCFTVNNVDTYEYSLIGSVHTDKKNSPIHAMKDSPKYDLVNDSHMNDKYIGPSYLGFNAGHVSVDNTNPESISQAVMTGRKLVRQLHDGLVEYEPKVFGASHLTRTGDLLGVRESRRIKCDYTFSLEDWLARRSFDDGIGRNMYYIDVHREDATRYPRYKKGESHGIPLRCMLPVGLKNVFVAGRCISTDHYAHGSLRVMPPCLVTGEAVGTAAAQIFKSGAPDVHNVDTVLLRQTLTEAGQLI